MLGAKTEDRKPVCGFTLDIDDIVALADKGLSEKAVLIACKIDAVKNNPKRLSNAIFLFADRGMIATGISLGWFMTRNAARSFLYTTMHLLSSPKNMEHTHGGHSQ
jgi:hypothetical protein